MQIGLGIHGEPGFQTLPIEPSHKIARRIIDTFYETGYIKLEPGVEVSVIVNNLGSTTYLELSVLTRDILQELSTTKVNVELRNVLVKKCLTGTFMTALDMHGISVSLCVGSRWVEYLEDECMAPAWPRVKTSPMECIDTLLDQPEMAVAGDYLSQNILNITVPQCNLETSL